MTPLAYKIVHELTIPLKRRTFRDDGGLLSKMSDVHCFECTEVLDAASDIAGSIQKLPQSIGPLAFLPAPKTWIEYLDNQFGRLGMLIEIASEDRSDQLLASMHFAALSPFRSTNPHSTFLPLGSHASILTKEEGRPVLKSSLGESVKENSERAAFIYALLALINTPRLIGRRQHMPHRGLEREILRAMKPVGKFPLHAWTEIKLEIGVPRDASDEQSTEAHLTGRKALHFCRAHLRIRLGQLEIVRSHWRGDAALGIKQSRYRLTQPGLTS